MDWYDREGIFRLVMSLHNDNHRDATRTLWWFLKGVKAVYRS